jgi:hypothetical protein
MAILDVSVPPAKGLKSSRSCDVDLLSMFPVGVGGSALGSMWLSAKKIFEVK